MEEFMGLRELKRLKTRTLLADTALRLFIERGYNEVTVAEIARQAEVSVTTLFKYFPSKEALVFDQDEEIEARLNASIKERAKGVTVLDSLEQHFLRSRLFNVGQNKEFKAYVAFVKSVPDLVEYQRSAWMRYEQSLARAIKEETSASQIEADTLSFLVLDGVNRAKDAANPKAALALLFSILRDGWPIAKG